MNPDLHLFSQAAALVSSGTIRPMAEEATKGIALTLAALGFDSEAEGLRETPRRWVKAMGELTRGYDMDPVKILATTFDGGGYDQIVILRQIAFVSLCEHHALPFTGFAHVGYIPRNRVVGLSKLARVVDAFARRFQIQERMTREIADAIQNALAPVAVGVMVEATHSCVAVRGVSKTEAVMVTSDVRGAFRDSPAARDEFFALVRGPR